MRDLPPVARRPRVEGVRHLPEQPVRLPGHGLQAIGKPEKSFDLVSPYFVPGDEGTAALVALARGAVRLRIRTNSLAASDVSAVHAGYGKRRRDLPAGGARFYELEPTANTEMSGDGCALGSSSSAGLHAKTFAVDGARVFVGSFNFDMRSALLNTEMGLVIERLQAVVDA